MIKLLYTLILLQSGIVKSQDDILEKDQPYLVIKKLSDKLHAQFFNTEDKFINLYELQNDVGLVNENFKYSDYAYNVVMLQPAQNIQKIIFKFEDSCKIPIVFSVQHNDTYTYTFVDNNNIDMYYDQLGPYQLQSMNNGSDKYYYDVINNSDYVDSFSKQEIVYEFQETSRQIAVICLLFDSLENSLFEFNVILEKYQIQNEQLTYNFEKEEYKEFDINIRAQQSFEVLITTEANELELNFDYDSSNIEYQVIQVKSDKNIEYKQQSQIRVVGIGPGEQIELLVMNKGNQAVNMFITAETFVIDDSKFPIWAIILIVILSLVVLVVIVVIVWIYCKKKKQKKSQSEYPEEPEEFNKEKAKIVKEMPNEQNKDDMIGSRVHYPEFQEDEQTNIDVFTVKLKEEDMHVEYPSNINKENIKEDKQFKLKIIQQIFIDNYQSKKVYNELLKTVL